jgi:hypothetical protein
MDADGEEQNQFAEVVARGHCSLQFWEGGSEVKWLVANDFIKMYGSC